MDVRPAAETLSQEDLLKRVIQNQRTLIEQNTKILGYQQQQEESEQEQQRARNSQVPLFVKVSTASF